MKSSFTIKTLNNHIVTPPPPPTLWQSLANLYNYKTLLLLILSLAFSLPANAQEADPTDLCSRTVAVKNVIVSEVSGKTNCADITTAELAGVTSLAFSGGTIGGSSLIGSNLKSGDFAGLTGLTDLRLRLNEITTLPADIFSGLSALETLRLDRNQLSTLPTGVFAGLTSLTTLNLSINSLPASLPASLFADLPATATITLPTGTTINAAVPTTVGTIDNITDLIENGSPQTVDVANKFSDPNDTLTYTVESNNTATATVEVSGSAVTITPVAIGTATITVTAADTAGQTATQTLMVSVNAQEADPTDLCSRTEVVKTVIISKVSGKTDCADITSTDLAGVTILTFVGTGASSLRGSLKSGDFAGLTGLTTLRLDFNEITTLPADIFSGLSALTSLRLDDNQLSTLPSGIFAGLTSLTTLNLSGNSLPASLPASLFADVPRNAITLPTGTTINAAVPTTVGSIPAQTTNLGVPLTVNVANKFSDTGDTLTYTVESNNTATATVEVSGSAVTITPVAIGTADITVTATDTAGQTATQTFTVSVISALDTTPPTITLLGSATLSIALNTAYTDAGAMASDNTDGNITASITTTITFNGNTVGAVNPNTAGVYTIAYNVSDTAGNPATPVTRTVTVMAAVADTTPPTITLLGSATLSIALNTAYTDTGATASDNTDGNITTSITTTITFAGNTVAAVNPNTAGVYTIAYNVSDMAGNPATPVTRTVTVMPAATVTDTTPPTITLLGNATLSIAFGTAYTDAGATASDNIDGNITTSITTTITFAGNTVAAVNPNTAGVYTIAYNVSDMAGNQATPVTRTVTVMPAATDTTPPTITLLGNATLSIAFGTAYTDAGATASDNTDGVITASITTTIIFNNGAVAAVNPNTAGVYSIAYNVSDMAGNQATPVTRTVTVMPAVAVADTTPPTITLLGNATLSIAFGTAYTDTGATASDNIDGNITTSITTTITFAGNTVGAVNPNTAGVYSIAYNVSDMAGNQATPVTRTVTVMPAVAVADTTPPTITLLGNATLSIAFGTAYTDAGTTAMDNIDGNITASITTTITFAGNTVAAVNPNTAGVYTIAYNVSDMAGNQATPVTRTVTVMPAVAVTDTTPPTITLLGNATLSIAFSTAYTDAGATASDNIDGNITASITTTITFAGNTVAAVNPNTAGVYSIAYNVSDTAGNPATPVTRTVTVMPAATVTDTTPPTITLLGSATLSIALGTVYTDAGATASDNIDGNITASITTTITFAGNTVAAVNPNTAGVYTIAYNVSDTAGNQATPVTRTVTVVPAATVTDTTPPTITLLGSATLSIALGTVYTDAGAMAIDNIDGNITASITTTITFAGNTVAAVNPNTAGVYTIAYNVSDTAGNQATPVTRTVTVMAAATVTDTTPPTITLLGNATLSIAFGTAYTDAGATASDNTDGNITASITTTITFAGNTVGAVNPNTAGVYTIAYNVSDMAGNQATPVTRTVTVMPAATVTDTTPPTITLLGNATLSIAFGTVYTDAGATASDNTDGNITTSITTTITFAGNTVAAVNPNTAGVYSVAYNVSDMAGNPATPVTRTVTVMPAVVVADTTPPTITLLGSATLSIAFGTAYTDAGATASDNIDGNITASITTTITFAGNTVGAVNPNTAGVYTIAYNVSDTAGNQATPVTRTVTVMPAAVVTDTTPPTITLLGSATLSIALGTAYTDAGAMASDNTDGNITTSITTTITFNGNTVGAVNPNTAGVYTIAYNVSDTAGNQATPVTRTVTVMPAATVTDTTPPTITLLGSATLSIAFGTVYTDTGATASDDTDGNITASITTTITFAGNTVAAVNPNTAGVYSVAYNVSDTAGNPATPVIRTVTVMPTVVVADTTKPTKQLNEAILPNLVQTMLASTMAAVSTRMDAAFSGTPQGSYQLDGQTPLSANLHNTVEQKLPTYIKALKDDTLDWKRLIGNSSFVMPLNALDEDGGGAGATVWGSGEYINMSDKGWKGDVFSLQIGVDQRMKDDLLAGGLVSWSKGDVDYTLGGERGKYTHRVTSIHPYMARSRDGVNLWGSVGYGQGELSIKAQGDNQSERSSDTCLLSLSAGVSGRLTQSGQSGLNLKSDMSLARTNIDGSADIPADKLSSQRLRLLLEIDKERPLASGGRFKPVVEVGLRYDGGTGESGIGAVLGLGGRYANATGLTVEGKIHTLAGRKNYKEWGIQGTIRKTSANEQGLTFSLSPSYGATNNSANQAWERKLSDGNNRNDGYRVQLDVNMGYGLFTSGGLLTPYSELRMGDSNRYRLGLRWKPNSPFSLHLYGERKTGNDSDRILLETNIRF